MVYCFISLFVVATPFRHQDFNMCRTFSYPKCIMHTYHFLFTSIIYLFNSILFPTWAVREVSGYSVRFQRYFRNLPGKSGNMRSVIKDIIALPLMFFPEPARIMRTFCDCLKMLLFWGGFMRWHCPIGWINFEFFDNFKLPHVACAQRGCKNQL